jgi:hypothetical protein
MPVYEDQNHFIDTLVHELIHRLLTDQDNFGRIKAAYRYIDRKYKGEARETRLHIPIHAIHAHIYMKFFDEARLKAEIEHISFLPDYRRSWEIVQAKGYKNIIRDFRTRIPK